MNPRTPARTKELRETNDEVEDDYELDFQDEEAFFPNPRPMTQTGHRQQRGRPESRSCRTPKIKSEEEEYEHDFQEEEGRKHLEEEEYYDDDFPPEEEEPGNAFVIKSFTGDAL